MKRIFILPTLAVLTLTACKKDEVRPLSAQPRTTSVALAGGVGSFAKSSSTNWTSEVKVSSYGYLQIPDAQVLADYTDFLKESSEDEVASFFQLVGFKSQASQPGQADNGFANPDAKEAHYFNTDGVVQIGDLIIRGIQSQGYLLVMKAEYISDETYAELARQSFDPAFMCKLRIGADYGESLQEFVNANTGHDGTNDPVTPQPSFRLFGWGEWQPNGPRDTTGHQPWIRRWYFLGIPCGWDYDYR